MKKVLISAGEPSGDLHASTLIREVRKTEAVEFYGLGGDKMKDAGCTLLYDYAGLSIVGFSEIFSRLSKLREVTRILNRFIHEEKPALVILVDYPGFNLRIARAAKAMSIPVVYYISPQAWAWGRWRVRTIERYVDEMICILPFELDFYRDYAVKATFVGHPLLDLVMPTEARSEFKERLGLRKGMPVIGLLPGSRGDEVKRILPIMLKTKEVLEGRLDCEWLLVAFPGVVRTVRNTLSTYGMDVRILEDERYEAMKHSDILLCTSGTATLEALILGTPMLILYKVSLISWLLGRLLVKIPHIGLVNIIAGRELAKEFIQFNASPQKIAAASLDLLKNREQANQNLQSVRNMLGDRGAARRAAFVVREFLSRS
ncbi:hypothetical protein AMJ40_06285 [candidate division TA06 bacterium DG_26]|uniref:Lipid-A-disaccharide synthase n=1 Tax=candidate division TA06 bacterium DG_26 TaxID=1703771 RepID=A0A0S7WG95_UNCT6|nr:MAG: hypothetical protein AMJ40_06285 [candidate division TA06 bacterium DG_26]